MNWISTVAVLAGASVCSAQVTFRFQGEVQGPRPVERGLSWVELEDPGMDGVRETNVAADGRFRSSDEPAGNYRLRILDASGSEIGADSFRVETGVPVSARFPEASQDRPTGESISVAQLRHYPSRRQWRELLKAQHFTESGRVQEAVATLQGAVRLDPEFIEAHANLGAALARLGQYEQAAAALRRAIELDPASAPYQSNLAYVLLRQHQPEEAEQWARAAVNLDGSNAKSHYILGCVLSRRPQTRAAGIQQLRLAARALPAAHQTLAAIYDSLGNADLAEQERLQAGAAAATPRASVRMP
ncbi:MAG: tetratricopeptide repeat protein [Acidobacteriia bacterium]|nr:tetratricopeptide repeat protein [Terriglobia bacterium]